MGAVFQAFSISWNFNVGWKTIFHCIVYLMVYLTNTSIGSDNDWAPNMQNYMQQILNWLQAWSCKLVLWECRYNDVIMGAMASQITSLTIVCSAVYSMRRSKKTSKLRVTGPLCGNSPVTGEFPAQRASNVENVSIWWRHHVLPGIFLQSTRKYV